MARPRFVALTTDFGLTDVYAGILRGVIRTLSPEAEVLDVSHAVAPGDLHEAAFFLLSAVPFLPKGTIHLCVVDPGVGTARRVIAVRAGGHTLVAPDNGVLAPVVEALGGLQEARYVTNERLMRPRRGMTFQGRDVMAPVCAHLCRGIDFALVGDAATAIEPLPGFAPAVGPDRCVGRVLHVDRFGNVVTNFVPGDLTGARDDWRVVVGDHAVARWADTYGAVAPGELLAYPGSVGFIEIAVREGHAADRLGARRGAAVTAMRRDD
ncbi:MAG: SAM-dependent chlorinase/fluorinase [Planctomycetes bacterium]|nr:SAM-dependent chlorinase/fluorinase [Planctomycetota bacterium]